MRSSNSPLRPLIAVRFPARARGGRGGGPVPSISKAVMAVLLGAALHPCLASAAEEAAEAVPQWIWHATPEGENEFVLFVRQFGIAPKPGFAAVRVTCDDAYELYVNGVMAGKGAGWQDMEEFDVTAFVGEGRNTIGVRAENQGDAAGFVLSLRWSERPDSDPEGPGPSGQVVTDARWKSSATSGYIWDWKSVDPADQRWAPVRVIGPFGTTPPWGDRVQPPRERAKSDPNRRVGLQDWSGFTFSDGDRIVLLGETFVEREQLGGFIETALTAAHPDKKLTFRNLGWSGDDVQGTSRGRFGFQPEGFRHLEHHVTELKPTVIMAAYGRNEAFAGPDGLPAFRANLERLLDVLESTGARIVLVTPHRQEALGGKLPDPSDYNRNLALYVQAIREAADRRGFWVLDLHEKLPVRAETASPVPALTYNSLHLTDAGYRKVAEVVVAELGLPAPEWPRLDRLRARIVEKNELYFHRWRPQNETYLTLFRKHEQGNNYREIPLFDPLIEQAESDIGELKLQPDDAP